MRFLVYSFKFDWRVGGIVVLNKLANLLAQEGHETFIIDGSEKNNNGAINIDIEQAIELAKDKETVVIYPEVIIGNPLKAKKVARWILFFPGFHGGEKQFDDSEYIFTYNKAFVANTPYQSTTEIRIVETMVNHFYDLGLERLEDAILIKKGKQDLEERERIHMQPRSGTLLKVTSADEMIEQSTDISDYNKKLNQVRYFISYDNYSYHSILALLAGCISVVIPELGKTKEIFFAEYPERKSNVLYGFEENSIGPQKPELLRDQLNRVELSNIDSVRKLVGEIHGYFNSVNSVKFWRWRGATKKTMV